MSSTYVCLYKVVEEFVRILRKANLSEEAGCLQSSLERVDKMPDRPLSFQIAKEAAMARLSGQIPVIARMYPEEESLAIFVAGQNIAGSSASIAHAA